jgi:5-methylcytosine-specific restriction protein A
VQALSELLRAFPHHSLAARKESFRNADGVAFKLQNLRQVATGKELGNVSKMDREVWDELGNNPKGAKEIADLIRSGIEVVEGVKEETREHEVFVEGKVVTEIHLRRERDLKLRQRLLEQRSKSGVLKCDICGCVSLSPVAKLGEAMFEAHHILPLAAALERKTKLKDMALLCANCHRMIHRAISLEKRWLTIEEAKIVISGADNA